MGLIYRFTAWADSGNYLYQHIRARKLSDICHAHDYYEWIIIAKGSCVHDINGTVYHMQQDEMVLLRPNEYHTVLGQSDDVCVIALSVQKEEFEQTLCLYDPQMRLYGLSLTTPVLFTCPAVYTKLQALFGDVRVLQSDHDHRLLLSFLIHAYMRTVPQREGSVPLWLTDVLKQMEMPEHVREGLPALIRLSNYSQSRLSKLMHQYMHTSLHDYVLNLRLAAAHKDLILTEKALEEIGEGVGYASFSHFQKIFKQKYGITPAELRKKRGSRTI